VSQEVNDIVERLEPGVHQFLPVTLRNGKRGQTLEMPYYHMIVLTKIEAIDVDRSESLTYGRLGKRPPAASVGFSFNPHVAIDAAAVQGHHLWRDPWMTMRFFMSDALFDALAKAKLKGFTSTKLHD
jgi:hypothetical protein